MIKSFLISSFIILSLAGCGEPDPDQSMHDQCLREQLFSKCLSAVPNGPITTNSDSWSEVVHACSDTATYLSTRPRYSIKRECRL